MAAQDENNDDNDNDRCNQESNQTNDDSNFVGDVNAVVHVLNLLNGNAVGVNVLSEDSDTDGGGDNGNNENSDRQECDNGDGLVSLD